MSATITGARDLLHFSEEARKIILRAIALGGSGRVSSKGHAILRGPSGETMSVSRNSGSGRTPIHKVERDFKRLFPEADKEETVSTAGLSKSDLTGFDKDCKEIIVKATNELGWSWKKTGKGFIEISSPDGQKTLGFSPGTKPINPNINALRRIILQHGNLPESVTHAADEDKTKVPTMPTPATVKIAPAKHEKTLVKQEPWKAKGALNASIYVVERTWSDGSVDYACADGDFESGNPRSVSGHANRAHRRKSEQEPPKLEAAVVEPAPVPAERTPADEIVSKIRSLVDDGEYDRLRARIAELEFELETVREEAVACRTRADHLAGNLSALRELMQGIDITEEETS